jgi:hypothetical protein
MNKKLDIIILTLFVILINFKETQSDFSACLVLEWLSLSNLVENSASAVLAFDFLFVELSTDNELILFAAFWKHFKN